MSDISFFTAVKYNDSHKKTWRESLSEIVDNYFYLSGKKAHVIGFSKDGKEKVVLSGTNSSLLARIAKVISYFTPVSLLMLITKAALRLTHRFKVIDPKKKLEKGMSINATANKIHELLPKILKLEKDDKIEWLSTGNNSVFKLKEHPNLVFKLAKRGDNDSRFENMVKAKEVCLADNLDLLFFPHATKFTINWKDKNYTFIAEEALNFNPTDSAQEELYHHTYSKDLSETARQLATFVARTRFNDVTWRNIPIITEASGFQGNRRVALIDLEHMESAVNGFTGDANGSCGLIQCVSEKQVDIVIAEMRKQGVKISEESIQLSKKRLLEGLESDKKLQAFHAKNRIVTGKEPIQVDLDSLGLNLEEKVKITVYARDASGKIIMDGEEAKEEEKTITLRQATEDVIKGINNLIQKSSDLQSNKGKRDILLNTNIRPFSSFEGESQTWLKRIVSALVNKGHLFKLIRNDGNGYNIQA